MIVKCLKDLYSLNSKYKKSFIKGRLYSFNVINGYYFCCQNETHKESVFATKIFNRYFE